MEALSISYKRYFSYTVRSLRAWLQFRSDQQVAHQGQEIIFSHDPLLSVFLPRAQ